MKTKIRIWEPKQIISLVFSVDGVCGDWRLFGYNSGLVTITDFDKVRQRTLARVGLHLHRNQN